MINEKNNFLTVSWLSGLLSAEIFISTGEWGVQMPPLTSENSYFLRSGPQGATLVMTPPAVSEGLRLRIPPKNNKGLERSSLGCHGSRVARHIQATIPPTPTVNLMACHLVHIVYTFLVLSRSHCHRWSSTQVALYPHGLCYLHYPDPASSMLDHFLEIQFELIVGF